MLGLEERRGRPDGLLGDSGLGAGGTSAGATLDAAGGRAATDATPDRAGTGGAGPPDAQTDAGAAGSGGIRDPMQECAMRLVSLPNADCLCRQCLGGDVDITGCFAPGSPIDCVPALKCICDSACADGPSCTSTCGPSAPGVSAVLLQELWRCRTEQCASPECRAGTGCGPATCPGCCAAAACHPGVADDRCGSSGVACTACSAGARCMGGQCLNVGGVGGADGGACPFGTKRCGTSCTSVTDWMTGCGSASCAPCPAPANASPTCAGGQCGLNCAPGFVDCDGPANGCECGATNAQGTCTGATCVLSCIAGGFDCDGNTSNGCECPTACPCVCMPTTCAQMGKNCGQISDGCGGLIACGNCPSPQTCGGGGIPNECGGGGTACSDGIDNDDDTLTDLADPGCAGPADGSEKGTTACDDGLDNDGDTFIDYRISGGDPDCTSPSDTSEGP